LAFAASRRDSLSAFWAARTWCLDEAGRITVHRDYWDAAEELYEKLPLVGRLMRWLKRRANA
jgi:hypothetical protein